MWPRLFSYLSWSAAALVVPLSLVAPSGSLLSLTSSLRTQQLLLRSDLATASFLAPAHTDRRLRSHQRRTDSSSLLPKNTASVSATAFNVHSSSGLDNASHRRPAPGGSRSRFSQAHSCISPLPSRSRSRRRRTTARFVQVGGDNYDSDVDSGATYRNNTMTESLAPQRFHTLNGVERVYCLSDLHTDHSANLEWLRERMKRPPPGGTMSSRSNQQPSWSSKDLLVIAGDISHNLLLLEETLECLLEPGCQVLFVAGNHEAWREHPVDKRHRGGDTASRGGGNASPERIPSSRPQSSPSWSSLDKLDLVYETCRRLGVLVDPCFVPSLSSSANGGRRDSSFPSSLYIVPLQSWYDGTLSFAPELEAGFEHWPWVDFSRCVWPADRFPLDRNRLPQNLVEYLLEANRPVLNSVLQHHLDESSCLPSSQPHAVMTVSHFLPNFQSLPDWKDLDATSFDLAWLDHGAGEMSAKFAKVAGSAKIDEQVRSLRQPHRRQIHVFGHSHRPKDFEWAGIRYVHNPLGKPRERELHMIDPDVDFQLVWDATTARGEVKGERVLRYWDERGGGKEALWERLEQNQSLRSRGRYNNPPKRR